jgi:shikimate dehydrogenase
VAAVIGDPVDHSLSPAIHNAAFRALDLDWIYVAFPVAAGSGADAVAAMRALDIRGLSVTMPHKADVAAALDRVSTTAERLGAVNTVLWRSGALVGDNTDGDGFVDALRLDEGFEPEGRRCLVVGAGGAARAVILALGNAGAAEVVVVNRSRDRAELAAALTPAGRVGVAADAGEADLVVNATPLGMGGDTRLPIEPAHLGSGQLVVDLVYRPAITPLLDAARASGAAAASGLGMLIHQAAHAFRLWTGEDPPLEAMSAATLTALTVE